MQNYEDLIMSELVGQSPKAKYEYLNRLTSWGIKLEALVFQYNLLVEGLKDTPDDATVKNLRSVFAGHEVILNNKELRPCPPWDQSQKELEALKAEFEPTSPVEVCADMSSDEANKKYGEAYGIDWVYPDKA